MVNVREYKYAARARVQLDKRDAAAEPSHLKISLRA
jgi:hypothetical protein